MIDIKNRIVTQLLSIIHMDKKDPTAVRIDIASVVRILNTFGYNLPQLYEKKLEEILNTKMAGKAPISPGLKYNISELIIEVADRMHVDEAQITKYISEHETEEDVRDLQKKIKEWRKKYYGSMDKSDKQALIDSLHDKLRPDVLDEINRA